MPLDRRVVRPNREPHLMTACKTVAVRMSASVSSGTLSVRATSSLSHTDTQAIQ